MRRGTPGRWLLAFCLALAVASGSTAQYIDPTVKVSSLCALAFSSDGRLLAAGASDGWVGVWDVPAHRLLYERILFPSVVASLQFADSDAYLVAYLENHSPSDRPLSLVVLEALTGEQLSRLGLGYTRPRATAFLPGEEPRVALVRGAELWLFSLPDLECTATVRPVSLSGAELSGIASVDHDRLVATTNDGVAHLLSTETWAALASRPVLCDGLCGALDVHLAAVPGQRAAVLAPALGARVLYCPLGTEQPPREFAAADLPGPREYTDGLCVSPSGDLAASWHSGPAPQVWTFPDGEPLRGESDISPAALYASRGIVLQLAIPRRLARLWSLPEGKVVRELPGVTCAAFHPRQDLMAYTTDVARVWIAEPGIGKTVADLPTYSRPCLTVVNDTPWPLMVYVRGPFSEEFRLAGGGVRSFKGIPPGAYLAHADAEVRPDDTPTGSHCSAAGTVTAGRLTVTYWPEWE